MNVHQQ